MWSSHDCNIAKWLQVQSGSSRYILIVEWLLAQCQQWSLETKYTLPSHLYRKKLFLQLNLSVVYQFLLFFGDTPVPPIGRPTCKSELVEYLRILTLASIKIASILGVSRATLYCCLDEWHYPEVHTPPLFLIVILMTLYGKLKFDSTLKVTW